VDKAAVVERREMVCPFCGHAQWTTRMIGAMFCGPHKVGDEYFPARQMVERSPDKGSE